MYKLLTHCILYIDEVCVIQHSKLLAVNNCSNWTEKLIYFANNATPPPNSAK